MRIHPRRLEAIGFAILLVAIGWEFWALRDLSKYYVEFSIFDINEKLKLIWSAVGQSEPQSFVSQNNDLFLHGPKSIIDRLGEVIRNTPLVVYSKARMILFLLGSVLIIVSKWRLANPQT